VAFVISRQTARGIQVSYEAIGLWWQKFGPLLASELRRHRPRRGDRWFVDEVAITMNKRRYWLWRADADLLQPLCREWVVATFAQRSSLLA
jgi:transposase-like protein